MNACFLDHSKKRSDVAPWASSLCASVPAAGCSGQRQAKAKTSLPPAEQRIFCVYVCECVCLACTCVCSVPDRRPLIPPPSNLFIAAKRNSSSDGPCFHQCLFLQRCLVRLSDCIKLANHHAAGPVRFLLILLCL